MTNMARPLRETGVAEGSFNRHAPLANRREEGEGSGNVIGGSRRRRKRRREEEEKEGGVKFARESSDGFYRPVVDSF